MFAASISFNTSPAVYARRFETAMQAVRWIEGKAARHGSAHASIDGQQVTVIKGRVKGAAHED